MIPLVSLILPVTMLFAVFPGIVVLQLDFRLSPALPSTTIPI